MTLLASERSLLIRNKFRSVLQLRIQNRRQSEINADPGLKSTCPPQKAETDQSEALRLTDDGAAQKLPPSGLNTETAQERTVCGAQRQKKARQAQDLTERIQRPPGPAEQQHEHTLPLENPSGPASFPLSADVFEDDISSSSSSSSPTEQSGVHQSPAFSSLPGLSGDQLLSDFSAVGPPLNNHSPGHAQSGLALLPATEGIRPPMSVTLGESNSMATTGRPNGIYLTSQTTPLLPKTARPASPTSSSSLPTALNFNHPPRPRKPRDTKPKMRKLQYHQYIPPDQRGGSGAGGGRAKQKSPTPTQPLDPAYSHLLKQQQVFLQLQILQNQQQQQQQLQPQPQLTVVPSGDHSDLVKSSGAMPLNPQPVPATTNHTPLDTNPAPKPELLPANLVDLTVSELRQQLRKRGLPVSGTKPALLQRLRPFQHPHSGLTPAPLCQLGTSLEPLTPCPALPPSQSPGSSSSSGLDSPSSSPNQQMYIPDRGIPNGILSDAPNGVPNGFSNAASVSLAGEACGLTNAVFLAPASTASGTPSPSLPMSSSSPLQCGTPWRSPGTAPLTLEEELQEAIQKAQMDPRQSIDDILDEPMTCVGSVSVSDHKSPAHSVLGLSPPPPQADPSQASQQHNKDDNFLPSPLCSSLLLELPPSPAVINPSQVIPAPPPPPICTSPLPSTGKSRKRRAPTLFDAADWLETLTSGLRPLSPPTAPFVESDFSLDSDLNVGRVLDLMIEQW
ncbi:MEF2-activating motif and SAP domain-containing transcriptional regulator [Chelmon rostratus]|uniref:MEF2-activating motif and SAP domain-containing transcriptional regulator n=1 Tax=Chelmon rostratus TaxID=109905 RepID=UPI001BE986C3|nr:MEF2-activating motif and SAP domain-containing transcriptional regulator [Chelmon rostratus]